MAERECCSQVISAVLCTASRENSALAAVEDLLPPGKQSLGTLLDVSHVAPTPVGMEVISRAELIRVEGRRLIFRVEAHDEVDLIGEGRDERVVVTESAFVKRVATKSKD